MSESNKPFPKTIRFEDYVAQHPVQPEPAPRATPAGVGADAADPVSKPAHHVAPASAPMPPKIPAMSEGELTSHNYDGIQEYDNPTPNWWYLIFAASIVFAVLYVIVYQLGGLVNTPIQRHVIIKAAADEIRFAELSKIPMGEDKILQIMSRPEWLSRGESIFLGTCVQCHGTDGSGMVGPNLTDEVFKNVRTLMDIPELVTNGAGNGLMPPQSGILNENEIALVAAYAASLRGKNLPTNPLVADQYKAGDPIKPWPVFVEPVPGEDEPSS